MTEIEKEDLEHMVIAMENHDILCKARAQEKKAMRFEAEAVALLGKRKNIVDGPWAETIIAAHQMRDWVTEFGDPENLGLRSSVLEVVLYCVRTKSALAVQQLAAAIELLIDRDPAFEIRDLAALLEAHRFNQSAAPGAAKLLHEIQGFEGRERQFDRLRKEFNLNVPSRAQGRPASAENSDTDR